MVICYTDDIYRSQMWKIGTEHHNYLPKQFARYLRAFLSYAPYGYHHRLYILPHCHYSLWRCNTLYLHNGTAVKVPISCRRVCKWYIEELALLNGI